MNEALAIFKEMQSKGVEANQITYSSLINACAQGRYVSEALSLLNKLKETAHDLDIPYQMMIDLYLNTGDYQNAKALFLEFDGRFWKSLFHFKEVAKKTIFDCHYLAAGVAILLIEEYLDRDDMLEIITGRGLHSKKDSLPMKDVITIYFKRRPDIRFTDHPTNPGRITAVREKAK